jgi:hypothetical protein
LENVIAINFLISDTFTDSLAKLSGDEQKAVKTTAFDLLLDPANPGMSFHKLSKAYEWAERHRLETHHKTGAFQLLEIRETIKEVFIPTYVKKAIKVFLKQSAYSESSYTNT